MSHFYYSEMPLSLFYSLSLHDALPIFVTSSIVYYFPLSQFTRIVLCDICLYYHLPQSMAWVMLLTHTHAWFMQWYIDRKSTRLNSSHVAISYAVFCLQKKTSLLKYRTV